MKSQTVLPNPPIMPTNPQLPELPELFFGLTSSNLFDIASLFFIIFGVIYFILAATKDLEDSSND